MKKIELVLACVGILLLLWALAYVQIHVETITKGSVIISSDGVTYEIWGHKMTPKNIIFKLTFLDNKSRVDAMNALFMAKDPKEMAQIIDQKTPWTYKVCGDKESDLFGAKVWGKWVLIDPSPQAQTFFREKAEEYGCEIMIQ